MCGNMCEARFQLSSCWYECEGGRLGRARNSGSSPNLNYDSGMFQNPYKVLSWCHLFIKICQSQDY